VRRDREEIKANLLLVALFSTSAPLLLRTIALGQDSILSYTRAVYMRFSVSAQYFMVYLGVQRLYALQICAIHKGIAYLHLLSGYIFTLACTL